MVYAHVVRDAALSAQAVRAYAILATYASNNSREAFPLRSTLAKSMGASLSTMDRALTMLERAGYLTVQDRPGHSNMYVLHDQTLVTRDDSSIPPHLVTSDPPTLVTGDDPPSSPVTTITRPPNYTTGTRELPAADATGGTLFSIEGGRDTAAKADAKVLTDWWWERQSPKPAGKHAYVASLKIVQAVLAVGHTPAVVGQALKAMSPPLTTGSLEYHINGKATKTTATGTPSRTWKAGDQW